MSKGVKMVLGVVASIAIPFVAAPIAAAIGFSGIVGSTLVGAALGAGAAAATGSNPLLGAAMGGFGGFMGGGGMGMVKDAFGNVTNAMGFGGEAATAGAAAPVAGVEGVAGVSTAPTVGPSVGEGFGTYGPQLGAPVETTATGIASSGSNPTSLAGYPSASGTPMPVARGVATAYTGSPDAGLFAGQSYTPSDVAGMSGMAVTPSGGVQAASGSGSSGFSLSSLGDKLLSNPGALAQLGMTMFNKAPQELTAAEKAALEDTARLAGENKALFEKRVSEAESLMNRRNNPEQAYAQTGMLVQRRLEEAQRGKPEANAEAAARRAQIEGSRLGTLAASEAEKQSLANEQAGLAALPTTAPTGAAGLSLPIYAALDKRREAYNKDLATSVGGLFGSLYGKTAKA